MRDGGKIVGWLIVAGVTLTIPTWLLSSHGKSIERPATPRATACVEPAEEMRKNHPELLAEWRERVVRSGDRVYHSSRGTDVRISLTGTCLGCHGSAAEFCNKCHTQTAVALTCWQCHAEKAAGSTTRATQLTKAWGQGFSSP